MSKNYFPYIGVTGFMNRGEVLFALSLLPKKLYFSLMVGILVSEKTLSGNFNKHPYKYPKKERISEIFVEDPRVFNVVHFHTGNHLRLSEQLNEIVDLSGNYLHGFQLNIAWPEVSQIEEFKKFNCKHLIILQINKKTLTGSMNDFLDKLGNYVHVIDAVLFDLSGGEGKLLNVSKSLEYLRSIKERYPFLNLGVAGGLGPKTLNILNPIDDEFETLSRDAEQGLQKKKGGLCLNSTREYINKNVFILKTKKF